jgi:C-terminal processing protease CtpA/Prc
MRSNNLAPRRLLPLCTGLLLILQGCGGSGGSGGSGGDPAVTGPGYFDPPFASANSLQAQCTGLAPKKFIRAYLDENYLWPEQVQRRDALSYDSAADYFKAILAPPNTDRFSFSSTIEEADARETGEAFDVGIHWVNAGSSAAPLWRVARVEPASPAAASGIRRGDTLSGKVSSNLYSSTAQTLFYNFSYLRNGQLLQANLKPATIFEDPVGTGLVLSTNTRKVGYLGFESHYGNAQDQLIESLQSMAQQGVQELVLDLRYNSGGYLYIASTLASMLTPLPVLQTRPEFIRLQPNAKLTASYQNAVLRLSPFVQYVGDNAVFKAGSALPQLPINRVYVLTTGATCSASESLVNGLRGLGVTVHTIGDTTCGKPYGMSRQDNCGTAYYPIEFRGVNARGESDFADGFAPRCVVPDDLDHERGDVREAQLKAALTHMQTGQCPATAPMPDYSAASRQMSPKPLMTAQTPPQRQRPGMTILQPRH